MLLCNTHLPAVSIVVCSEKNSIEHSAKDQYQVTASFSHLQWNMIDYCCLKKIFSSDPSSQVPTPKAPPMSHFAVVGGAWLMTTHFHGPWEHHDTASQPPEPVATPLHSSCTHPAPCGVCGNVLYVYMWWKRTFSDLVAVFNISSGLPSLLLPSSLYTHEDVSPLTITCLLLAYAWI